MVESAAQPRWWWVRPSERTRVESERETAEEAVVVVVVVAVVL